jgi:AcrR family transcriptional regulator
VKKPSKPRSAPRKLPSQSRSRERVERILDAAARTFAKEGYEAATVERIAEKAETSIGSVYQFFPNKLAIFNAVSLRYLEQSRVTFEALMSPESLRRGWEELVDHAIDAFASLDRNDADWRAVWTNWHLSGEFFVAGEALNREFAKRIETILGPRSIALTPEKRALVARITVELVSALLFLAARTETPRASQRVVDEAKVVVKRYITPYTKSGTA